jgi:hypothetical protein
VDVVIRALETPRLETAVASIMPVAEAIVVHHEGAAPTEVDGHPRVLLALGEVPGTPVVLDQAGGVTIPSIIIQYARHLGDHLAAGVGVLVRPGVGVGADVVDRAPLDPEGGKLALMPAAIRRREEEGGGGRRGEEGQRGQTDRLGTRSWPLLAWGSFDHIVVGALCAQQKHKAALAQPVSR